eukprot:m.21490 g.21490  ORF g.21490 m.21490 type:complete len:338 (+) comp11148_c0_seq5:100-1113(+)
MPIIQGNAGTSFYEVDVWSRNQQLRCVLEPATGCWWCIASPGSNYAFRIVPSSSVDRFCAYIEADGQRALWLMSTEKNSFFDHVVTKTEYQLDGSYDREIRPICFAKPDYTGWTTTEGDPSCVGTLKVFIFDRVKLQAQHQPEQATCTEDSKAETCTDKRDGSCKMRRSFRRSAMRPQTTSEATLQGTLQVPEGKKWYEASVQTMVGQPIKTHVAKTTTQATRWRTGQLVGTAQFKFTTQDALHLCGWDGVSDTFTHKKCDKAAIPSTAPPPATEAPAQITTDEDDDDEIEVVQLPKVTPATMEELPNGGFKTVHEGPPAKRAKDCISASDVVVIDD